MACKKCPTLPGFFNSGVIRKLTLADKVDGGGRENTTSGSDGRDVSGIAIVRSQMRRRVEWRNCNVCPGPDGRQS